MWDDASNDLWSMGKGRKKAGKFFTYEEGSLGAVQMLTSSGKMPSNTCTTDIVAHISGLMSPKHTVAPSQAQPYRAVPSRAKPCPTVPSHAVHRPQSSADIMRIRVTCQQEKQMLNRIRTVIVRGTNRYDRLVRP
jgi:hypothetical protein